MGLPPTKAKNLKPQNVGYTPLSLVIFQCGIASQKNPKPQNLGSTVGQKGKAREICLNMIEPEMLASEAKHKKFV